MADLSTRTSNLGSQPGRIAAILGLRNASVMDDVALANTIADGLDCHAATSLGAVLGPKVKMVGGIIPETTFRLACKARKPLSRAMSGRLYDLGRVWEVALRSYGEDQAAARAFLSRQHMLLDGRTPLELAQSSSAGADAVVNLLRRAKVGFAV
ncbi:antitoxin Xre/MbcA/ParS toxin-binding domain-containing protein [Aliiroseovarius sp. F47248L]|uniref:antitoxin Xre/MbcA/ParS toxin-binding domain-containing protein n=1 Tax=Aliiroseovarius sp. F47248L TaxID=2926420 RepID=UPI001FF3C9C2|nr:antitoxin Xre/MbcA/ParS toxin-binding domain-containing protein [Aliiroseovarius sp. F47248L]MCK0138108.1 DUF2384 domain-containing protein [Aliiroseovarius sp. F47248L]